MGRHRKISRDTVLDAAERVVLRLGAAGLSIDAVAQEAGISKATVMYDHKSKSALLEAMIDRQLEAERKRIEAAVKDNAGTPHPELFGRIAVAERLLDDADKAVAMAVSASMSSAEKIPDTMREVTTENLKAVTRGPKPEAALLAYLALMGFCCSEIFNFHNWNDAERARILDGVRTIYLSYPET